jgi:putative membrane protein
MKKILKTTLISLIALRTTALIIDSLNFAQGIQSLILAALALTGFEYLLKPIAKILFLPINILTLGTLRWIINVIGLYLVTIFVDGFSLSAYSFPGLAWQGVVVPAIRFGLIPTYILTSLLINLNITLVTWIFKK